MEMTMNELKEKAEFFLTKKITAHIDTIGNSFFNGLIIEVSDSILIIHDRVLGETPIAFSEIKELTIFKEVKR